jgi:hypothetical protein
VLTIKIYVVALQQHRFYSTKVIYWQKKVTSESSGVMQDYKAFQRLMAGY